jgi:hypothetical protein
LDLSIIQGPFSVAPCRTLISRFATFASLYETDPGCGALDSPPQLRSLRTAKLMGGKLSAEGMGALHAETTGALQKLLETERERSAALKSNLEQVRFCRCLFFPYRRLRIQGGQGRGGLGYRFTE